MKFLWMETIRNKDAIKLDAKHSNELLNRTLKFKKQYQNGKMKKWKNEKMKDSKFINFIFVKI